MPGLLKDRPTGRFGRLISALRPARRGPLPVQTGFPTSLADLFVKNHGRLRKPSSCASTTTTRRKKRGVPPLPTPPPSPTPSPPASSPSSPPPPPATVSPPAQPITLDLPPAEPVCHTGGGGGGSAAFGLGLGFLALVGVVSLALLVIWSRKVVAAVTVAAFSLFLLESVRSFSLRRRPPPPATKEQELDLGGRGYVSPIREVESEPELPGRSFSDSGRSTDVASIVSTEDIIEEVSEARDDSGSSKGKSKRRSWKKLIPRKLQRGRFRREADSLSSSFRSESSEADAVLGGGNARATDVSDSRRGSGRIPADAVAQSSDRSGPLHGKGTGTGTDATDVRGHGVGPIEADASSADLAVTADDVAGSRSRLPFVAAVIVVLVGLAAGRFPAVVFTVLCSAFVSSLQRLPVGWRRLGRR